MQPVLLGAWGLQAHTSAAVCMMFTAFLCLLVHVDRPDICRLDMSMSGYVCGSVQTCPDLSIETAWICPDIVQTCLC